MIDVQAEKIDELESEIAILQASISAKQNTEQVVRQEIVDDDRNTQEELRRIQREIAEIKKKKTQYIADKEEKIAEAEGKEDSVRDQYHVIRGQMERADENVSDVRIHSCW